MCSTSWDRALEQTACFNNQNGFLEKKRKCALNSMKNQNILHNSVKVTGGFGNYFGKSNSNSGTEPFTQ